MEWYDNPILRSSLQSAFKRSNARIVNIAKRYGTSSPIYKATMDKFSKPNYSKFIGTSESGRKFYKYVDGQKVIKNITTGGYQKFKVHEINKYILSGKADRSVVNQLLSETIGYRVNEKGELEKLKNGGGIQTVTQIRKSAARTAKNMGIDPHEMTDEELDKFANTVTDFASNFQVAYDAFIANYKEDKARADDVIGQMYDRKKPLTYKQMIDINKRFNEYKEAEAMEVNDFENKYGKDL